MNRRTGESEKKSSTLRFPDSNKLPRCPTITHQPDWVVVLPCHFFCMPLMPQPRYPLALLVLVLGGFLLNTGGCDGPFPLEEKIGLPNDHAVSKRGALHKSGLGRPFTTDSGCSQSDCHHSDLQGGIAMVDGQTTVAPSCYQCHGKRWSGNASNSNDMISVLSTHTSAASQELLGFHRRLRSRATSENGARRAIVLFAPRSPRSALRTDPKAIPQNIL